MKHNSFELCLEFLGILAALPLIPMHAYAFDFDNAFLDETGAPTKLHIAIDLLIGLSFAAVPIGLYMWLSRKIKHGRSKQR